MGPGISGASKDSELVNNYTHKSRAETTHCTPYSHGVTTQKPDRHHRGTVSSSAALGCST